MFPLAARLASSIRSFSTSAMHQYPKLKTHSGAKKRWRSVSNGKFKRARPFHSHLNVDKTPAQKNRLAQTAYSHGKQTSTLKKLLPYGSP